MVSNGESPLTLHAQKALNSLTTALPVRGELTSEQVYALLVEEEDLERSAAEDILEWLHMWGYVYEVDGNFSLTGFLTTHLNGEHRQPDWRR